MSREGDRFNAMTESRPEHPFLEHDDRVFTHQIALFSVASAMIGVCLTGIGLITMMKKLAGHRTLCDALLALDSLLFLAVTVLSFVAIRRRFPRLRLVVHYAADIAMMLGLVLMAAVTLLMVFSLI
jgi:hypothetical protein